MTFSTPPSTSAAIQNFYEGKDYPSIIGFSGECVDDLLQPAPKDWSKCPALLGVLDYIPALAAFSGSDKTTTYRREKLVGVKYGGLICWHQLTNVKSLQNEQVTYEDRTIIKKAFVS